MIRQEVKADPEKKVQAPSAETVRRLGAVSDREQKHFTVTQLLLPPEWARALSQKETKFLLELKHSHMYRVY